MNTKVLFIGPSPSKKNTDPNIAFKGTKSYTTLLKWIKQLGLKENECEFFNISNRIGAKKFHGLDILNLYYTLKDAKNRKMKIITLGKQVQKTLDKNPDYFRTMFFSLPHPSGLNRKLNDKTYVKKELGICKKWLK